jgi:protoheme IX farnesyltransferase
LIKLTVRDKSLAVLSSPRLADAPAASAPIAAQTYRRSLDYLELAKPRVVLMVLVTTTVGFYLGSSGAPQIRVLIRLLAATALAAGGTLALNQYLERDLDARMERTRNRPLPQGRLAPPEALRFGLGTLALGLGLLDIGVGHLTATITGLIAVTYLLMYTPLKQHTSLCSLFGAIPGALPPVAGWAAAQGTLGAEPWILFAIIFLWQVPHTLAIGRLYRDDYARAGICVLPVLDFEGAATGTHAVANCLALLPVALLPTVVGLAGPVYFLAALLLGLTFLWAAYGMARSPSAATARRLLLVSLIYLPTVLTIMAFDKATF